MKQIVNSSNYTFNAAAKTITFSAAYTGLELAHIELVTNVTNNTIIYQFNKSTHGGTLSGLVLTLNFDTTSMSNTDKLQIFVEATFLIEKITISDGNDLAIAINGGNNPSTGILSFAKDNINGTVRAIEVINLANGSNPVLTTVVDITGAHISPLTDTQLRATALPISNGSLNNIDTNTNIGTGFLSTINTKIPSLGQALAAASTPIVLTAIQQAALTPPAAITGFATEVTTAAINTKIPSGLVVTTGRLQVELPAGVTGLTNTEIRATPLPVSLTSTTITGSVAITGALTDTQLRATAVPTSSASLPLPTGASTSALQGTTNSSLSSIDGKTPALGQALAASSTPVVLTAAQIATLTPPAAITGFALAANQQTNAITDAQIRLTPLPVSGTFFQATQPISGTVTANTGLTQPLTNTEIRLTPLPISGTVSTGGLTDTQIRATALPVSGTVSANATLSAETTKVIGTVNVAGTVPVSGSFFQATQPVSGTFFQATQPVSGSFFQVTQPVSIATMPTTAVTGSFFQATQPVSVLADADNTATGTLTAATQTVVLNTAGKSSANIKITNTWVGTITFEGTTDGTNWDSINAVAASTSTPQPTTTVNGSFRLTPASFIQIRVIMTAFTSGTATISMRSSMATGGIFANQILPVTVISNAAEGVVSTVNSSATTLVANGVFTGTSEDITNYSSVTVSLKSNVASATDGLSMQQSADGTNWDWIDTYSIPADTGKTFSVHISGKFFRIVYTNGATLQSSFRLHSIFHKYQQVSSSIRPQDARTNDNDFSETLGYLMGYNSIANTWNRVGVTSGNLGGNETLLDRLKVNASLRVLDTALTAGSQLVAATGTQALGLNVNLRSSSTLAVTVTAATGTAATLTLPAVAAQFHYITSLDIVLYSTAARTGTATPILVTTTNVPGSLAYTFESAGAIGTNTPIQGFNLTIPLKSSVLNTATTIVAPIVTGGIWRITATYFTGA